MNQDTTNLNQNIIEVKKDSVLKAKMIGLIISILNIVFCIIAFCIFTVELFSSLCHSESGSGLFILFVPVIIAIYALAYIPDVLCLIFSFLNYQEKKKKKRLTILIIVFSLIGYMIMDSQFRSAWLLDSRLTNIYAMLKIIMIIYNIILLILINKKK